MKHLKLFFLIFCIWAIFQTGCGVKADIEISSSSTHLTAFQGEKVMLTFKIANHLKKSIRPGNNYFLSYHLLDKSGNIISYDNPRFGFPVVLRRMKTTEFSIPVFFGYENPGNYIIEFDIVKEGEYWGSSKNWETAKINLHLKSLFSEEFKNNYLDTFIPTGNPELDREQYLLRITMKNTEMYSPNGKFFGFSAGSDYPQVWIRDTATFIAYAKSFYPLKALFGSVELFFRHQSPEGEIVDWVDITGNTDKMTVETDQESSLVLAAYEIGKESPRWFLKVIDGKTVWERLELAMHWVWDHKRLPGSNLICSGFTADWGDTENTFPDQRATKLSQHSTPVYAIYTQAKYIQAIQCLLRIEELSRKPKKQKNNSIWKKRLESLKKETADLLYLEDKGYYISHLVASPGKVRDKHYAMEKEMLAVGGNAEAIIAGLMDHDRIERFIKVLDNRRKEYDLRTVSFTLIPPYPEGFFSHHLLKHPWNYQNGGEWDWIGGRVVKALFLEGFFEEGEHYLLEIVKKNLANLCIYEWEDRQGTGRGAMFYAGAAGVLGEAIRLGYK